MKALALGIPGTNMRLSSGSHGRVIFELLLELRGSGIADELQAERRGPPCRLTFVFTSLLES